MSSRSLRRSTAQASADSVRRQKEKEPTVLEKLLLAQAVYEHGFEWATISQLLAKHPLINRPKAFFAVNACQSMYRGFLEEAGLPLTADQSGPKSQHSNMLAHQFYQARVQELRDLIAAEEAQFKKLFQEIEEIRSGAWDDRITADVKLNPDEATPAPAEADEDEVDSKQVQSQITGVEEGADNPENTGHRSGSEEYSSEEEPRPASSKARGSVGKRGRPKTSSPAVRRSRRLSTDADTLPVPEDEDEKEDASPAPSSRRTAKRKASSVEASGTPRENKRAREASESVMDEDLAPSSTRRSRANFQNVITLLHNQIHQHRNGSIFHSPIKDSDAENYHEIVKRPIDLKTIRAKIKDGTITNSDEYLRDIYLMFANAMMYNRPTTQTHQMAKTMLSDCEPAIHNFRQSETFGQKAK